MDFRKTICILGAAFLLFSTPVQAQDKEQDTSCGGFKPEWTVCTRSDDCMTGRGYCREPIAYARSAAPAITAYNQCMLRIAVCTSVNHKMPTVAPVCAAGHCVPGTPIQKMPGQVVPGQK